MSLLLRAFVLALALVSVASAASADRGFLDGLLSLPGAIADASKLDSARQALGRADYEKAIALCDEIVAAGRLGNGRLATAHLMRGLAFEATERFDEALAAVEKAIALTPKNAEAHRNRAILLVKTGHARDAIEPARRALALDRNVADGDGVLGWVFLNVGYKQAAVMQLERAIGKDPKSLLARRAYASALIAAGDWEKGVAQLAQALELARLDPPQTRAQIHMQIAIAQIEQERYEPAATHAQEALGLAPNEPLAQYLLGVSLYRLDRETAALAAFDRYLELDPAPDPLAWYFRGCMLANLHRFAEAIPELLRYREAEPDDPRVHFRLGFAHAMSGQRAAARDDFERRRALAPDACCSNFMLGLIDYFEGSYGAAETDFRREARIRHSPYPSLWLALIAERRGDDPAATLERELQGAKQEPGIDPAIAAYRGGSEQAAIDAARRLTQEQDGPRYLCETYTYLAERALVRGQRAQARQWFDAAVATGSEVSECVFAHWRLDELNGSR